MGCKFMFASVLDYVPNALLDLRAILSTKCGNKKRVMEVFFGYSFLLLVET